MLKQANARKSHVKVITPAVWAEKNLFSGIKSHKLWGEKDVDSFQCLHLLRCAGSILPALNGVGI